MIPAAQIFNRDVEAIRYRNDRIAAMNRITLRLAGGGSSSDGNHNLVPLFHHFARLHALRLGHIARARMKTRRNPIQRLACLHHVESPARSLALRDILQPLRKHILRARRNMQTKRQIIWRAHP